MLHDESALLGTNLYKYKALLPGFTHLSNLSFIRRPFSSLFCQDKLSTSFHLNKGILENALEFCSFIGRAGQFRESLWEIRALSHRCDSGRDSGWKTRREAEDNSPSDRPKYGKKLSPLAKRNSSLKVDPQSKGSRDARGVNCNIAGYWQGRHSSSFRDPVQDKMPGSIWLNQYGGS